jgi:diaminopropionate ammonia-lyase
VWIKDESARFGLNAFKVLGVRFAVERLAGTRRLETLTCATAGNHGRAVARVARELGLRGRIYVPAYTERARIDAIAGEGAEVIVFDGTYDAAVRACAAAAEAEGWTIVSDTGWPGYEEIPRAIMLGYTRLVEECANRPPASFRDGNRPPASFPATVVIVQAGVGGLAAATLSWLAFHFGRDRPFTIIAEPHEAACVLTSLRAGRPTPVTGSLDTMMGGLRCGEVSTAAWPALSLADACVTVSDKDALQAIATLRSPAGGDPTVTAGPSGACGLAALTALLHDPELAPVARAAGLSATTQVLLINSEGGFECGTASSH